MFKRKFKINCSGDLITCANKNNSIIGCKIHSMLFLLFGLVFLSSCASTITNYSSITKIPSTPKNPEFIEVLSLPPKTTSFHLGNVGVNGNGFSSHKDILKAAKKKAAQLGADFIVNEESGTDTQTVVNSGYTSYQSNGYAFVNENQNSIYGSANQQASAYTVGPSTSVYNYPWGVFSIWISRPSKFGVNLDDDHIITGFHLNSDAELSGMKIGDEIMGINECDINDPNLPQHLMKVQPGDKVKYTIRRNNERLDFTITALPN